jgi:hypothetical protein
MRLHRPRDFYRRVGAAGLIGFGESYMAGDQALEARGELGKIGDSGSVIDPQAPPAQTNTVAPARRLANKTSSR